MTPKLNATSHVNLDKALAGIRQYPGARTDRKVFQVIADYANDKGVAMPRQKTIAAAIDSDWPTVSESVHRLADKGFLKIISDIDINDHYRNTYKIMPAYMLNTSETADAASAVLASSKTELVEAARKATLSYIRVVTAMQIDYAERFNKLAKQLDDLADAINNN